MNSVQNYISSFATGATSTSLVFVGNTEQIILNIPAIGTVFGSAVVAFSLQGAASASATPQQMYYWDYGNSTPKSCVVTASTSGLYEMPNAGGSPYVKIQFDIAATKTTGSFSLLTPRTTY